MKKRFCITASTFDKRGRLISSANNSYSCSSKLMRYYAIKAGEPYRKYWHAEIRALELAIKQNKLKDVASLVVLRYDASGALADAKPCKVCQLAIAELGIKVVRYSTSTGMNIL